MTLEPHGVSQPHPNAARNSGEGVETFLTRAIEPASLDLLARSLANLQPVPLWGTRSVMPLLLEARIPWRRLLLHLPRALRASRGKLLGARLAAGVAAAQPQAQYRARLPIVLDGRERNYPNANVCP